MGSGGKCESYSFIVPETAVSSLSVVAEVSVSDGEKGMMVGVEGVCGEGVCSVVACDEEDPRGWQKSNGRGEALPNGE